jgi:dolichyl-phosphate-mannose--protein O-mannosyl transferase
LTAAILVFGYHPMGWRIMVVIFATLMVSVIYFFGKKLFRTWIGAFSSAFLLMFDFMHFTVGRIATVDTFLVFFSLTSHFFFFIYFQKVLSEGWKTSTVPLFLAVLFFALGFSTKWITLYGFVGQIFLLLIIRMKSLADEKGWNTRVKAFFGRPFLLFIGFLAFAIIIYFLTFVPHLLIGYSLKDVYDLQFSMYRFHSTLTATHPFSSEWWSWPFIARPVWLYVSDLPGGMVSTIVAMGNPAVWWLGFASIFLAILEFFKERNYVCAFIVVIFFFQWLPYAVISRCLFIYHFYSNVPFLIFATVYFLNKSWSTQRGKIVWLAYLAFVVVLFMLFYPVISGAPIPYWWRDSLRWFRGWVF